MVNLVMTVHNEVIAPDRSWFSSTGSGDKSHLTDQQRQIVEERISSRGDHLDVVYESGCEPYVTFPEGAALGVEADPSVIADMVARARTRLVDWR
jgi:hypothetical protein